MTAIIIILAIIAVLIISNIRVIPQAYASVVERLGAYHSTWKTGLHV